QRNDEARLAQAPAAGRNRQHGNQQGGRDDQKPMAQAKIESEVAADPKKHEYIHDMREDGKCEGRQQTPPHPTAPTHGRTQCHHPGPERHMAEPPRKIREYGNHDYARDQDQRQPGDRDGLPVIPGQQGNQARQADQREQEKPEQTETSIDDDSLYGAAQWHVHLVQKPQPHGVAADKSEGDLLEEKSAERDLTRVAYATSLLEAIEHKLQPQSRDEAGLAGEHDEHCQQGKSTQLVPVGDKERKIDLRNDDGNCKEGNGKLAGGNQQSSGGACAVHEKTPDCGRRASGGTKTSDYVWNQVLSSAECHGGCVDSLRPS